MISTPLSKTGRTAAATASQTKSTNGGTGRCSSSTLAPSPYSGRGTLLQSDQMSLKQYMRRAWPLYVMIVPGIVFVLLFRYYPMYGVVIAFQDFSPAKGFAGSPWIGWENFEFLFSLPEFGRILGNTVFIAVAKIIADQIGAIILALLLNEARILLFRRTIQTLIYLPYFLSWIVLGGILLDILAPYGILNQAIGNFGIKPQLFLGSNNWFRGTDDRLRLLEKCRLLDHHLSGGADRNQPNLARSGCH